MAYTYTAISPTPAWITVNSSTGLVTVDRVNAPIGGYTGIARFQVSDGSATATTDVPINVLAKYTVTTEYKELLAHRFVANPFTRVDDKPAPDSVRWVATAQSRSTDTIPSIVFAGVARQVQFQREFQVVASFPPVSRLGQYDRVPTPESGVFSPAIAALSGTAGLTNLLTAGSVVIPFRFKFGRGSNNGSNTIFRGTGGVYLPTGTQLVRANNRTTSNFIGWYGGGDANQYRIRYEAEDAPGGNPTIWEMTLFREGVVQIVTGQLGINSGNNDISAPLTPIAFVDNTSFVINYLKAGSVNSYVVRQGSYTI